MMPDAGGVEDRVGGLESNAVRATRIPRLVEELLGSFRVIPVVLLHLLRPFRKRDRIPGGGLDRPHGFGPHPTLVIGRVDRFEVDRHLYCVAYPDVVEGWLGHVEAGALARPKIVRVHPQLGVGPLQAVDLVNRAECTMAVVSKVVDLAGAHRRHAGRLVRHHQSHHLVHVGQAVVGVFLVVAPVVGILDPGDGAAFDPVGHHEGTGTDQVPPVGDVAVLVDHLWGVHERNIVVDQHQQRIEGWILQLDFDRVSVGGRDRFVWQLVEPGILVAGAPAVEVVHHIIGRELATVHRCLVVPANALAEVEDIGLRVGHVPTFGQSPGEVVDEQELVGEIVHAPVDSPVGDAELLDDTAGRRSRPYATDHRVGIRRLPPGAVGQRPTILRRRVHLAVGGVGHVLPVGGGCRADAVAFAGGERNGGRHRERQCHRYEFGNHSGSSSRVTMW